jgi:hypothetical protein
MGREWGGDEKGEVSLRITWGQGGRDRITPKEGFQVRKNILPVHPRNTQNFGWNFLNIQPYGWVANFDVIRHPLRKQEKKIS